MVISRVTTCLENLEMSGNSKHVREMSGKKIFVMEKCPQTVHYYMNIYVHMGIYLTLTPEVLATVYLNI